MILRQIENGGLLPTPNQTRYANPLLLGKALHLPQKSNNELHAKPKRSCVRIQACRGFGKLIKGIDG